ncbi:MAG TPA: GspH/FimT family pseudopilin [Thermoanaerobaculia bacterium]|nr:GspH/FimT family pseudopilin [Thermoanaerobaculia bacterium]
MPSRNQRGLSLIELLIVVAIIGLIAGVGLPSFASMHRRNAVKAACAELRTTFYLARSRAIAHDRNSGLKFETVDGEWRFALYDDGDGDGLRSDDIRRGVDRRVTPLRRVLPESAAAKIGLPPVPIVDPDGDRIAAGASPVQFNRSTICSFSPVGSSTPGTIYITDDVGELWAVRVYGTTAKMRLLRYDAARKRWEQR